MEIIIDLKKITEISSLSVGTYESVNDWIFGATGLKLSVSTDGKNYRNVSDSVYPESPENTPVARVERKLSFDPIETRYIRIVVDKPDLLPSWHAGAGNQVYLFLDEIIVD